MKKNWKWFVPACVGAIVALVLVIIGVIALSRRRACYLVHLFPSLVTEIHIEDGKCNSKRFTVLDLSRYKNLKSVVIGNGCFKNVIELKLNGLGGLKSVVVGIGSFSNKSGGFYLQDCSNVKELRIGNNAFTSFTSFTVSKTPLLETIVVGHGCFRPSSLEMNGKRKERRSR